MARKKDNHEATRRNSTDEDKNRCESVKNKVRKAVSKSNREKAEEGFTELRIHPKEFLSQCSHKKLIGKELEDEDV